MSKICTYDIIEKSSGKLLYRVNDKMWNKYYAEKAKAEAMKHVLKVQDLKEEDVELVIRQDYGDGQ